MTGRIDITTTMAWTSEAGKRKMTIQVNPVDDMYIHHECQGIEDQVLEMDQHGWHALYAMMGEVK